MSGKRILVEVWTDLVCPWCGIGERRFAAALDRFEGRSGVDVVLRAFRLMPGVSPLPVEKLLEEKYELTPEEINISLQKLEAEAASVGLQYALAGSFAGDALDAWRLIKAAQVVGRGKDLHARLFKAAMCERACIYERDALRDMGVACGLDRETVDEVLSGDLFREEVEADETTMRGYGGHSVPFFVFNKQRSYAGALSSDIFLDALRKTNAEGGFSDGRACGPDGCAIS